MRRIAVVIAIVIATTAVPVPAAGWEGSETLAPGKRVIEIVDKMPGRWSVERAVAWLDRYTGSDMRVVKRCSGKAYRCVTVKPSTAKSVVGWSQGSTILVNVKRAESKWKRYYRYDRNRTWLLVHELGHQHGLGHSSGKNVMNDKVNRYAMTATAGQRRALAKR